MDSFAKYTIIDWIAFLQVLLIWFYMAYRSGQWIVSVACSKGWRWWNRKNKKHWHWIRFTKHSILTAFNWFCHCSHHSKRHDDTNSQAKGGRSWLTCNLPSKVNTSMP